jgi:virulence-associated protein VagC
MSSQAVRLPKEFPVGTRYVIEGRAGHIQSRYLEFPDGRHVDLPADLADRARSRAQTARRNRTRRPAAK